MTPALAFQLQGVSPLLQVYDMPASVRFYRDGLGFEVVRSAPERGVDEFGWCLLRRDDVWLMLNTAYDEGERPETPDPARVAAHVDTTLYFTCPDVDAFYAYVKANGLAAEPPAVTGYGWYACTVTDPDGFGLIFHRPPEG